MSILFITHDLGVVAEMADDVAVMYAVESGRTGRRRPALRRAAAPLHAPACSNRGPGPGRTKGGRLDTIEGMVPSLLHLPAGCKFHPRCPFRQPALRERRSRSSRGINPGHWARCHFAGEWS